MSTEEGGPPILVLEEGTKRQKGKEALEQNIEAATLLSDIVRTSLGPRGLDKLLLDPYGDITVTNDGATILSETDIVHPAAKFVSKIAETQDQEVGDGTTTTVIIAGELLKEAKQLLNDGIHPVIIIEGFLKALEKSKEILNNKAIDIDVDDDETVREITRSAIATKVLSDVAEKFIDEGMKAIKRVRKKENGKVTVPVGNIKIEKVEGKSLEESRVIDGILLDKSVVHNGMPKVKENAKIALVGFPLEVESPESADVNITMTESTVDEILDWEKKQLEKLANKVIDTGADVVLCQKGIDDLVQHYLAKNDVLAVRRVKKSDMEKIAKATGGKLIMNERFLTPESLGEAGHVEERKVGDETLIYVEECKKPEAVTLLLRGSTEMLLDEAERAVNDLLQTMKNIYTVKEGKNPKVLYGGGAAEGALAQNLEKWAEKEITGKEKRVISSFANAVRKIPETLIASTGLDVVEKMGDLEKFHSENRDKRGIDCYKSEVTDMEESGIYDILTVKTSALTAATEAATMILRIDDVLSAKEAFGGG